MNAVEIGQRKRTFEILKARILKKKTLEELGREYCISRQRIWQILNKAVRDMEEKLKNDCYGPSFDDLSLRTQNVLRKYGFRTAEDVLSETPENLLRLPGFGMRRYEEIKAFREHCQRK